MILRKEGTRKYIDSISTRDCSVQITTNHKSLQIKVIQQQHQASDAESTTQQHQASDAEVARKASMAEGARSAEYFDRLCSSDDYESNFDARKNQAAAQLPAPLTEAIVRNARAELSQGEWGSLEQCIACYGSQSMSASDLLFCAKTMAPRSKTLAEVFGKHAPPAVALPEDAASADDMASLFALSRAPTTEDLGEEASLDDMAELMAMSGMSALPAPAEPAPTTKPLKTQRPPADTMCRLTEQRELLERYNQLVHFDQWIEKQMVFSDDTEEPLDDIPAMSEHAQPKPNRKTPPRTPPGSYTQRSRLWTVYEDSEELVPVAPMGIQAPTKASETQRPTPIQLLRQSTEIRAKHDNQEHYNDNTSMGVLAELIELKKQLQTKMSLADEKESGQYYKGHVTLKSLATQAKGEDAVLSLSDGNLSLVGGADLNQTLLSMPCSHVVLEPVPGHDNCIHFKTTKKNDKTAGVIIVLPSRSIRDEWLAASSSMDIKIEKWLNNSVISHDDST